MRREIVKTLNNIATLLELKGENSFKIRAYKTGSDIIENFSGDIEQIAKDEKLDEIKGIGKALASKSPMWQVDALLSRTYAIKLDDSTCQEITYISKFLYSNCVFVLPTKLPTKLFVPSSDLFK